MGNKPPQNLPSDFQLTKTLETAIGEVYFYDNIAVFQANEGVVMSRKSANSVIIKCLRHLGGEKWILISNRINSYSVKPMDYKALNKIPSLRSICVVYYSEIVRSNAVLESKFCKIPFYSFNNLNDGLIWAKAYLRNEPEII